MPSSGETRNKGGTVSPVAVNGETGRCAHQNGKKPQCSARRQERRVITVVAGKKPERTKNAEYRQRKAEVVAKLQAVWLETKTKTNHVKRSGGR